MPSNLAIDDRLLNRAKKLGKHKTKKETVNKALLEYIQQIEQQKIVDLLGTIEYDEAYNYKQGRKKR